MNVLLASENLLGGAGGAALRLHEGLLRAGVDSQILIHRDTRHMAVEVVGPQWRYADGWAWVCAQLDKVPVLAYRRRQRPAHFHPQWVPGTLRRRVARLKPDLINLHWVCGGFARIESLARLGVPLVWTLHDMWPFTGGCFYSLGCDRYKERCGACPQLNSRRQRDLSRWVWRRKHRIWRRLPLTVVACSSWLASCARQSSLLRDVPVEVIPNGLDPERFCPTDARAARVALGLPLDRKLVAFAAWADEPRKGFGLLQEAMLRLNASGALADAVELVVIGFSGEGRSQMFGDGIRVRYLGRLDEQLPLAYAAADVLVAPSVYDNLPCTVMEALACGTPCVAFDVGGLPDMIEHRRNGYLARAGDVQDLAQGIEWVLHDEPRRRELGRRARQKVLGQFTLDVQAAQYLRVYEGVLAEQARTADAAGASIGL